MTARGDSKVCSLADKARQLSMLSSVVVKYSQFATDSGNSSESFHMPCIPEREAFFEVRTCRRRSGYFSKSEPKREYFLT
jgi:hypothetical protein